MSILASDAGEPRHLLARLLNTPNLAEVVPTLDPKVLHQLVRRYGLEQCGEVIALATPQQLAQIFDDDLWSSNTPGIEDHFDTDRFGLWVEVLAEAGADVAAQKLAAMEFDFVTAALGGQFLVLDHEILAMEGADSEFDFGDYDPVQAALTQRAVGNGESCLLGGYTIIAKRRESWDALLALLTSLAHGHPVFFGKLMKRCCDISTEWIVDNGGLWDVSTSGEQVMADIAGAREERRAQQGHVTPSEAAAFLKLARQRQEGFDLDPLSAAYFRDLPRIAPGEDGHVGAFEGGGSDRPLLPAAPGSRDPLERIHGQLLFAQQHYGAAHARRMEELAYLANVLVAGCSFQSRRFSAAEAAEAVLAICNLGSEDATDFLVHRSLVAVFRTGWRILHEDVCLYTAQRLVDALADLRCDDRDIQRQITDLLRRMKRQVAAGTPWRERDNLNVIAILDTPSWAMLENLLDECPVVPKGVCAPSEKPLLRVPTEFEFISDGAQVTWVRNFAESLSERLL